MRKSAFIIAVTAIAAGCGLSPTAPPQRAVADAQEARYDGGALGGSGNRSGVQTTTATPLIGVAESVPAQDVAADGGPLGGSGN